MKFAVPFAANTAALGDTLDGSKPEPADGDPCSETDSTGGASADTSLARQRQEAAVRWKRFEDLFRNERETIHGEDRSPETIMVLADRMIPMKTADFRAELYRCSRKKIALLIEELLRAQKSSERTPQELPRLIRLAAITNMGPSLDATNKIDKKCDYTKTKRAPCQRPTVHAHLEFFVENNQIVFYVPKGLVVITCDVYTPRSLACKTDQLPRSKNPNLTEEETRLITGVPRDLADRQNPFNRSYSQGISRVPFGLVQPIIEDFRDRIIEMGAKALGLGLVEFAQQYAQTQVDKFKAASKRTIDEEEEQGCRKRLQLKELALRAKAAKPIDQLAKYQHDIAESSRQARERLQLQEDQIFLKFQLTK